MCTIPPLPDDKTILLYKNEEGKVDSVLNHEGNLKTNIVGLINYGISIFQNDQKKYIDSILIEVDNDKYSEINKGFKTNIKQTSTNVQNILNNLYKNNSEYAA